MVYLELLYVEKIIKYIFVGGLFVITVCLTILAAFRERKKK